MIAVLAANVDSGRLGRDRRRSNDNSGNTHKVRDIGCIQVADGDVRCRGVEKELVGGKRDVALAWVDNSLRALLQR